MMSINVSTWTKELLLWQIFRGIRKLPTYLNVSKVHYCSFWILIGNKHLHSDNDFLDYYFLDYNPSFHDFIELYYSLFFSHKYYTYSIHVVGCSMCLFVYNKIVQLKSLLKKKCMQKEQEPKGWLSNSEWIKRNHLLQENHRCLMSCVVYFLLLYVKHSGLNQVTTRFNTACNFYMINRKWMPTQKKRQD